MSTLDQAQFLRISTPAGVTLHRWQSMFNGQTVAADGADWLFQRFEAGGITNGQTGDEGGVTITLPAVPVVVAAMFESVAAQHVWELTLYQFWPGQFSERIMLARFAGVIVQSSATVTTVTVELGSTLEPIGAQIPPRTMSTRLIGKGCRL